MPYQCKRCGSSTVYHSCAAVLRARTGGHPMPVTTTAECVGVACVATHPTQHQGTLKDVQDVLQATSMLCRAAQAPTATVAPSSRARGVAVYIDKASAAQPARQGTQPTNRPRAQPGLQTANVELDPFEEPQAARAPIAAVGPECVRCGARGAEPVPGTKWCFATEQKVRVQGDCLCRRCRRQLCDELEKFIPTPGRGKPGGYLIVRSRRSARVSRGDGVTLLWLSGRYLEARRLSKSSVRTVRRRIV